MPGNYFDQFDDDQTSPGPVIRAAPRMSPAPNDYTIGKDARDANREDRREARDDRRDTRSVGEKRFDQARQLRGDYDSSAPVKAYGTIIRQYANGVNAAQNVAGDQSLINSYAQMLNPTSTVMLGEYQATEQVDSAVNRIKERLKREFGWDGAGRVSPKGRDWILGEMQVLTANANRTYSQERERYRELAQRNGFDPVDVVGDHLGRPFFRDIERSVGERQRREGAAGASPWRQDTTTMAPAAGGFASAGDERTSIPVPDAMQREHMDYVTRNRGRLNPDGYAAFRAQLDAKYGFPENTAQQLDVNRQWAIDANERAGRGGNLNLRIAPPDRAMTVRDRVNNSMFNNPVGAALMDGSPLSGGLDEAAGAVSSLVNGTSYQVERDKADGMRQSMRELYPNSSAAGSIVLPTIMGGIGASALLRHAPRLAAAGSSLAGNVGLGAVQGALDSNDNRMLGAAAGAGSAAGGELMGRYVLGPAVEAALRSKAADSIANTGIQLRNTLTGRNEALRHAPRLTGDEKAMRGAFPELDRIRTNVADAKEQGLPYALADASPKLRALTGSITRRSVDARELAENTFGPRGLGQADRAIDAIDKYLAPDTNLAQRRDQHLRAAQEASRPLYDQANAMGVEIDDGIRAELGTQYGRDALGRAVRIAEGEGKDPFKIGFVYDEGNKGYSLRGMRGQDAWRYERVPMPDEMGELSVRQMRGYYGKPFTHRGPIDLVTWLRQNGGLQDHGGELRHMGLTNRARSMDFAGNDHRFGPLLNPDRGMNFDDAAELAWEAGYFPGQDRPSINEFLDTLRATYEGRDRRFLLDDMPEVERFDGARDQNARLRVQRFENGSPAVNDRSQSAGQYDYDDVPLDAYNVGTTQDPTFETVDLVKRGFDARLAEAKNPLTGEIDFESNPELGAIEAQRQRYIAKLDAKNHIYPQARAEYEKHIGNREALDLGYEGFGSALKPRDMEHVIRQLEMPRPGDAFLGAPRLGEYRRGYATGMADKVRDVRLSNNPFEAIYGAPQQREKIAMLYPDAPRFERNYQLETDMNRTKNETLGGSATAGRLQADKQLLGSTDLGETLGNGAMQFATGGGVPGLLSMARTFMNDRMAVGFGNAGVERADRLAPLLMNTTDQQGMLDYLDDIARRNAEIERRRKVAQNLGGLLGGFVGGSNAPSW